MAVHNVPILIMVNFSIFCCEVFFVFVFISDFVLFLFVYVELVVG